jgi:two-component sensor histidine kinase
MNVTKKKRAEDEIRRSLHEKEVLLREIHHRVKNNFQIVISLLNLQSTSITDHNVQQLVNDYQRRIRAMALVHEKMYHTAELSKIDFSDYALSMINEIVIANSNHGSRPEILSDLAPVFLDIESAIPCGLIINELVTNIFKYAFPEGFAGERRITLKIYSPEPGIAEMFIADNGAGIPGAIDIRSTETLGLRLVVTLAEIQLKGKVSFNADHGSAFTITFPINVREHGSGSNPGESPPEGQDCD